MPSSISGMTQIKPGTCPHGLPVGTCPICNGKMAGSASKNSRPVSGQMTWSECFSMGQMMRAQSQRAQDNHLQQIQNIKLINALTDKISSITSNISSIIAVFQKSLPVPLANFVGILNRFVLSPVMNFLNQIPKLMEAIQNGLENVRNFVSQIAEKLVTVIGEFKNFVSKKLSDFAKTVKKKFFKLFSLFLVDNEEDGENKEFLEVNKSNKN